MKITTLPVYSRLADVQCIPDVVRQALPEGVQLSQHQLDTYLALTEGEAEVIFNTAMTGDGKSLAAYLPILIDKKQHAFGMYPTIELSRDQERQFRRYISDFNKPMPYCTLWGAELTRLADEYNFKYRADVLQERFENHNVILTNPDIFNLVMNYRYHSGIFSPEELPYSLSSNFNYFVFDEFHIFATPQVVSALTAMTFIQDAMHNASVHRHFLFSSATPNLNMLEMLQRSGINTRLISGQYASEATAGYRFMLHPVQLNIEQLREKQTIEDWIANNLNVISNCWRSQSVRPKGAIIVNSVVAARRIARLLEVNLADAGISIGENTGLTDSEQRKLSHEKDIVVGTSTIDVGVDFNINLLIFEASNAGAFLQRLGRLGRYKRDALAFDTYQAFALISGKTPWIYERIKVGLRERGISDGESIDRPSHLAPVIQAAYPDENEFLNYPKRWGILQAAHVINILEQPATQGAYLSLAARLTEHYKQLFNLNSLDNARKRYWWISAKEHVTERIQILDEVLAFRGSSPFDIGLWDATVEPNAFLAYDLFAIVQTTEYEVVSIEDYQTAVAERYAEEEHRKQALNALKYTLRGKNDLPLILKVTAFNAEREWLKLQIGDDLSVWNGQVKVVRRVTIREPRSTQLPQINDVLKRQSVVCYACKKEIQELRRILHLPAHFPLYRAYDMHENREYTVAFGKPALMLEAQLLGYQQKDPDHEPVIA